MSKTETQYFVSKHSIVRQIWGKADTILFVFGGSAAEFALNKAVDWLYYTGKLPADPLGRLFSTVRYAQKIIFMDLHTAHKTIDNITAIHQAVEHNRGQRIPDWAYRDVLFMLIHYSITAFELLERKLSFTEKEEVFDVFYRVGARMNLQGLPQNYSDYLLTRKQHLEQNILKNTYTQHLYVQYKKHLGWFRYAILIEGQKAIIPVHVRIQLGFVTFTAMKPLLFFYKIAKVLKLEKTLKLALLPPQYYDEILVLDMQPGSKPLTEAHNAACEQ
jgi:hypothetical protein